MLKLPEERRRWGESKGAGREKRKRLFFSPPPPPFPSYTLVTFRPRTYCKGYYFYSPQSSTVIKSKMAATTILRTQTRFRPPKIRLHCRLRPGWRYHARKMAGNAQELKTFPKGGLQGKILLKEIIVQFQVCYDRWRKEVKKHFFTGLASIWNSHLTRRPVCYSIYCVSLNFKHWLAGICGYFILCLG